MRDLQDRWIEGHIVAGDPLVFVAEPSKLSVPKGDLRIDVFVPGRIVHLADALDDVRRLMIAHVDPVGAAVGDELQVTGAVVRVLIEVFRDPVFRIQAIQHLVASVRHAVHAKRPA
ncbi:MAG TPA: hypothetical protein VGF57_11720 [Roseiarcus sp.]